MAMETKHLHYIEHRHEAGYGIKIKFTCKGDRTSECHQYPDCECENYYEGHEKVHPDVTHDECVWQEYMRHCGCPELCGPHYEPVRGGPEPIVLTLDECAQWEYANPRDGQATAVEKARSDAAWVEFSDRQGGA